MMSQNPNEPLPYASPRQQQTGLPTGVQALLGTIATVVFMTAAVIGGLMLGSGIGSDRAILLGMTISTLSMVVAAFIIARTLRRNPMSRGWAIGIYIGLGLGGLFWGVCGAVLYSLSNIH